MRSDERDGLRRALGAAAEASFFLLLGLAVVWFARKVAGVQDGAVLAAFVIVPALLYLALRGNLAELRGPGGWAATFIRVARARVSAAGETLDVSEDVQILEKESMVGLTNRVGTLQPDQPILMTITLGKSYTKADIQGYLGRYRNFHVSAWSCFSTAPERSSVVLVRSSLVDSCEAMH